MNYVLFKTLRKFFGKFERVGFINLESLSGGVGERFYAIV